MDHISINDPEITTRRTYKPARRSQRRARVALQDITRNIINEIIEKFVKVARSSLMVISA